MESVRQLLNVAPIKKPVTYLNLAMYPLFLKEDPAWKPDFVLLDEALANKMGEVTESSAGGIVEELKFTNTSNVPVFLLDGEELVGAKQNRIVNLSVLAPAGKAISIPVSCVEQGRWRHVSREFKTADRVHFARGRARKMAHVSDSLRQYQTRDSDQGEVWREIGNKSARLSVDSPTMAIADVYAAKSVTVDEYVRALNPVDRQVGALFTIDGSVIGLDLFGDAHTLAALLPKLVRSYALDAIDSADAHTETVLELSNDNPAATDPEAFLDQLKSASGQSYPAVGLGEDERLSCPGITAAALVWDGRLVHLSAFAVDATSGEDGHVRRPYRE